ncbi:MULTISPECIES: hypothetical protein [unclassified Sutcliffiella]|uniref:phage tail protein n=1 Tax=unclassified Sutcliffiella TaxID=2837532 RepID=UPI0030CEFE18
MNIFTLSGKILIDDKKAADSLHKTEGKAGKLGKGLQKMGKFAVGAGALIGGAAVAGGAAMFALGTKVAHNADRLLDLNSATGMSTDEIQRWEKATRIAGVSQEAVTNASKKLNKSMETLTTSGGKGADAMAALGISVDDIANMDADERMNVLTEALSGVEDKTDRAKLGVDIFGGSWEELAPIVDLGAEAMENAKNSANIISEDDLKKANDFRIKTEEMKDKLDFFTNTVGLKVIPVLNTFMDWIMKHMPTIESVFKTAIDVIGTVIDWLIDKFKKYLIPVFQSLADWVKKNLPQIKKFFTDNFKLIQEFIDAFVKFVMKLWGIFGDGIMKHTQTIFKTIVDVIKGAFKILQGLLDFFIGLFTGDWKRMGQGLEKIWDGIWKVINSILSGAWGILSGTFSGLGRKISDWFTGLKRDAVNWGKNLIQGFIDGIAAMIGKVKDAASNVTKAVKGFLGFNSPSKYGEGRNIVKWGRNFIDGFLDGSEEKIPEAEMMMNRVVGAMKPTSKPGEAYRVMDKLNVKHNEPTPVYKQPITIQAVTTDMKVLAEHLVDDITDLQGFNTFRINLFEGR